jgi:hypothetical protein
MVQVKAVAGTTNYSLVIRKQREAIKTQPTGDIVINIVHGRTTVDFQSLRLPQFQSLIKRSVQTENGICSKSQVILQNLEAAKTR